MLTRSSRVPLVAALLACNVSFAGGRDHKIDPPQDTGIWSRSNQLALQNLTIVTVVGGALWLGSDSGLGHTFWQSVDSSLLGAATAAVMKPVFSRSRPRRPTIPATGSRVTVTTASRAGK